MAEASKSANQQKNENPITSIVFNVALPMVILTQLSSEDRLGPIAAWVVGLGIPVGYAIWDFSIRKKISWIAVFGFISILLKGALGVLKVDLFWFAVNEAALPLIIGVFVVGSLWTQKPFVKTLLLTDQLFDLETIDQRLKELGNQRNFDNMIKINTLIFGSSFLLSSILNFALAVAMLKSDPGTEAFNNEMGQMMGVSYVVIVLPCLILTIIAIWHLLRGLKKMTGLELESILKAQKQKTK